MLKRLTAQAVTAIAWLLSVLIVGIGIWVFAFDRYNPTSKQYYDGFGRELRPSAFPGPYGMELSPGFFWEIVYTIVGITLFGICASLFAIGERLKQSGEREKRNNQTSTSNSPPTDGVA